MHKILHCVWVWLCTQFEFCMYFSILVPIPAASNLNYSNLFKRNWWDPDNQKLNDCPVCHWEHRTRFMTAGIQEESTLVIPQLSNKAIYLNIISFFFRFYMSHIICLSISGIFSGWIQDYSPFMGPIYILYPWKPNFWPSGIMKA